MFAALSAAMRLVYQIIVDIDALARPRAWLLVGLAALTGAVFGKLVGIFWFKAARIASQAQRRPSWPSAPQR